ncbi:uncharacterized protein LOC108135944 isoform X2 [Drosophila elegans]|uniref:uncharacterized protein LOC108135944 isoform X2 n=1 Tax=Drosophila elegans TaxID=30023 RepID=UPI0007E7635D|nr:uncharacterized protein LOC108135944 isoform X2 [Drosophila elegans]
MKKAKGSGSLGSKGLSRGLSSGLVVSKGSSGSGSASAGLAESSVAKRAAKEQQEPKNKESQAAKESAAKKKKPLKDEPLKEEPLKEEPLQDAPMKEEPLQAKSIVTISIPAIDKLRRYCFIGSTDCPVYAPPTLDLAVEISFSTLRDLCAEVTDAELAECLAGVLGSGPNAEHLPRPNEPLLILAVFLSTREDEKQRKLVRSRFPDLITSESDLLLFVQLVRRVQKLLDRQTPFNRTVRKAILDWYGHQSVDRLLHLWSVGDGTRWAAHRDLLHRCHFRDADFRPEVMAALKLLSSSPKELAQWPTFLTPLANCRATIEGVLKLRLLQDPEQALPIVKKLSLSWEHVPLQLLNDPALAKFLVPRMTYDQLLQCWPRLSRLHSQVRAFADQLLDEKKLKAGNVPPVRLLLEDMRLRRPRKVVIVCPTRTQRANFLHSVYEASFGQNKALGRRLHITLNLEQFYLGKHLSGRCRSLKYLDALVALAFGYFRSDPKVTVQFWHDRSGQLKTLPWTKEMSLAEATACCQNQKVLKTKQTLTDVLDRALEDEKNTYDVFLVLVPGAGRGNPGNNSKSLAALMDDYREKRSSNAKFVMVSLRQHHASMMYSGARNENLLELCSLDEHTPRLINAFARRKFY